MSVSVDGDVSVFAAKGICALLALDAKGLTFDERLAALGVKMLLPISAAALPGGCIALTRWACFESCLALRAAVPLCNLVPLNPLTLPGFRRQALLLHVNRYSLRSRPSSFSGRSAFSCRSKHICALHVLHCAKFADGGLDGSGHVCTTSQTSVDACTTLRSFTYGKASKLAKSIICRLRRGIAEGHVRLFQTFLAIGRVTFHVVSN